MVTSFPGFQILQAIHQSAKTIIYQAKREVDSTSVVIKTLKAEYPTLEEITRLRHEYQILRSLNIENIIRSYDLLNCHNRVLLILEEFGGVPLKQAIATRNLSIEKILTIAITLTQTLEELHKAQVIHKDIKPQNILINPQTGRIKLIDFSIATRLEKETQVMTSPNQLEGTLAYMSPEQTGRMNRILDYRTDFYSLGITFYEMLTGQLPFITNDPMEMVHCHIAKVPITPHQLNDKIPETISKIVMKLLSKTAEDRYQSSQGLNADLRQCLKQWQNTGKIENLTPGALDLVGRFLIPQKLYGREIEVTTLLESFNHVSMGATELMLVSGYSGVGKTCVVQEIYKPITRQRGYFIAGKFDQFQRNIPYAAIVQAFQELMRQILTESRQNIEEWKINLQAALKQNGRVIIDVIPELELIIGKQLDIPVLGTTASQNRFNQVFQEFVRAFCNNEHPLVVFLDDLQWADIASLKLIELLMTDPSKNHFLLIGAYRDNEVNPTHPTIKTIEEIQKLGTVVNNIVLQPLKISHIRQLVADTLDKPEKSKLLADLLFSKTQGNPFFFIQLFKTLYAENLLGFDFNQKCWQWSIEQIQSWGVTDMGVVNLVSRNIQKLPEQTQNLLKLAACIGNRFYLDILSIVNEKSLVATAEDLWIAIQAGLILPMSQDYKIPLSFSSETADLLILDKNRIAYKFLHDRVQQAAYSLIPEEKKQETHFKIGHLLWEKTTPSELEENVFDIVNQLNISLNFLIQEKEKEELANLNYIAGKKAKQASAYEAALKYLQLGVELLPETAWKTSYEFKRNISIEYLECLYINSQFEQASNLSDLILSQLKTNIEKISVYELKIPFYYSQNQIQLALETARQILKMLNIKLPHSPNKITIILELIHTKITLRRKQIEELEKLPVTKEPSVLAAMKILVETVPVTFLGNPMLFPIVVFNMIRLCIKHGNSSLSSYAYVIYGQILAGVLEDIDSAYQFGNIALVLLDKFDDRGIKAKVYFLYNQFIRLWKEPLRETLSPLLEAFQSGIETGDLEFASLSSFAYTNNLFYSSEHLDLITKNQIQYLEVIQKYKQELVITLITITHQCVLNLVDNSEDPRRLVGDSFDEKNMLSKMQENNDPSVVYVYLCKSILNYCFKDYSVALENSKLTADHKDFIRGTIDTVQHNFYYSLALLANYSNAQKKRQNQYLTKVKNNQKQMRKWASHAPMNFQHKYDLVEAERHRIMGKHDKAAPLYDHAIAGAKTNKYTHEEALANELAAEFYNAQGRKNIAKTYMTEAYYGYIRWGAKAKVKDLDQRYPDLISRSAQESTFDPQVTATTTETSITATYGTTTHSTTGLASQVLDLNTVFKASLALSGELVVENLLEKLLKISIENAGASSGLFLTKPKAEWVIEAKGQIDPSQPQETEETRISVEVVSSSRHNFPLSLLNYVEQTKKSLVLNDATTDPLFAKDSYIEEQQPKSILCVPLLHQNKLTGILYLENNETPGAFTEDRLKVINLLASQISISVDNARLYTQLEEYSRTLESKVEERTQQLSEKNDQLKVTLKELKSAQKQIVAQEKLASLGSLTAGIAHEIRNPLNFVNSLANLSQDLTQDIAEEIDRQSEQLDSEAVAFINESLDYLKRNVSEIHQQGKRADSIITSMLMHARTGSSTRQAGDINFVISEAVQLAHQSLRAKDASFNVELNTQYDDSIGQIFLAAADLGRGIINIVDNACYAARKKFKADPDGEFIPTVTVTTENRDSEVEIRICDNGDGIPPEIQEKIFNPFFTTKPTGEGTGLGLSISHDIIVGQHQGTVKIESEAGNYTHFIIVLPRALPGDNLENLQPDRSNEGF